MASAATDSLEIQLMRRVRHICGEDIRRAVAGTIYPESFIAALAANESGGNPAATRFEPGVFAHLGRVITGQEAHYGGIGAQDLIEACSAPRWTLRESLTALANFSTSWGPTQIMGYSALGWKVPLSNVVQLDSHFGYTVRKLDEFCEQWKIDISGGAAAQRNDDSLAELLRCWNTGAPNGETKDPLYVGNALARMAIYAALPPEAISA